MCRRVGHVGYAIDQTSQSEPLKLPLSTLRVTAWNVAASVHARKFVSLVGVNVTGEYSPSGSTVYAALGNPTSISVVARGLSKSKVASTTATGALPRSWMLTWTSSAVI